MKLITTALLAILLTGCVKHSSRMNRVSMGMTKPEVIKVMGKPVSVTADKHAEYLNYSLLERFGVIIPYEVKMVNGAVESFGRVGPQAQTPLIAPIYVR